MDLIAKDSVIGKMLSDRKKKELNKSEHSAEYLRGFHDGIMFADKKRKERSQ